NNGLPGFFNGLNATIKQPRFCFVPTVSSLAIPDPWPKLTQNICTEVNCMTPSAIKGYYAPSNNQLHISYTQPSADWMLEWQDASFDCAKICESSVSISGPSYFCGSSASYTLTNLPAG